MAFSFKLTDETPGAGFRRIALSQLDAAVAEIDDAGLDPRIRVHQARKRCKKVRSLIRLVRPAFADYVEENAAFRDMARPLSGLRDREALPQSFDALAARHGREVGLRRIAPVGRALAREAEAVVDDPELAEKSVVFRDSLLDARIRARAWKLEPDGFAPIAAGMARIYGEARQLARKVRPGDDEEAFHEWRKRVKYHWHHSRLLRALRPEAIELHGEAAGYLAALLGEHHDLAVLSRHLADAPDGYARVDALLIVEALVERRSRDAETEIFALAEAFFEPSPDQLAESWTEYWDAWRTPDKDTAAGEETEVLVT